MQDPMIGKRVFTRLSPSSTGWSDDARKLRKNGIAGTVTEVSSNGHGLSYGVRHPDGKVGQYGPDEIVDFSEARVAGSNLRLKDVGEKFQIGGAVWIGENVTYVCLFPGESPTDTRVELAMTVSDWESFIAQTDSVQQEVLQRASDGSLAKVIVRKCERQIDVHVNWRVFARDGFRCRYCGKGDGTPLTVDHLVCFEDGGPTAEANLVASCRKCNKVRGNLPFKDWLNHQHYQRTSKDLSPDVRDANRALVATLDSIPLRFNQRTR